MTDQELIEAVATKVMGYTHRDEWWVGDDIAFPDNGPCAWNPLTNDVHMDMVLDRMYAIGASDIICNLTTRDGKIVSECSVLANDDEFYGVSDGHSMAALKRAMLITILEATYD